MPNDVICGIIIFVSGDGGMADALDSGSSGSNPVRVQVPFSAPEGANLNTPKRILHFFEKVVAVVLKFSK